MPYKKLGLFHHFLYFLKILVSKITNLNLFPCQLGQGYQMVGSLLFVHK